MSSRFTCIAVPYAPALSDEDQELDPDRWCSHSAWGQECWQIISQWVWNLRLELGHQLEPTPLRTTEFAPAISLSKRPATSIASPTPTSASGYGPPATATRLGKRAASPALTSLSSPTEPSACHALHRQERRREADGSLRVVYAASIRDCRPCPLREQCQWEGHETRKPRQVSVRLASAAGGSCTAAASRDWSRRVHRRACMQLVRDQRIEISLSPSAASPPTTEVILSREQRAHSRLWWAERLARNGRVPTADQVTIKLFGIPAGFATSLGLATV